jgi:hypothetical protein
VHDEGAVLVLDGVEHLGEPAGDLGGGQVLHGFQII